MLTLNMQNDVVYFKDIKLNDLPQVLKWYNNIEHFKFATGIDSAISLEALTKSYSKLIISSTEFFVGIFKKNEHKMIGILKGRLQYKNKGVAWISSLIIDPAYQHKGYGSNAINLLIKYFEMNMSIESVYLSVAEQNLPGREFWIKHNFKDIREIENHLKLQNRKLNVIIMCRYL